MESEKKKNLIFHNSNSNRKNLFVIVLHVFSLVLDINIQFFLNKSKNYKVSFLYLLLFYCDDDLSVCMSTGAAAAYKSGVFFLKIHFYFNYMFFLIIFFLNYIKFSMF